MEQAAQRTLTQGGLLSAGIFESGRGTSSGGFGPLIRATMISFGPLAQRLVQRTHNPLVVGSNPTGPII